jgi:hypothetical protein
MNQWPPYDFDLTTQVKHNHVHPPDTCIHLSVRVGNTAIKLCFHELLPNTHLVHTCYMAIVLLFIMMM